MANRKRTFEPDGGWTSQYGYNHLINRIHSQDTKIQKLNHRLDFQSRQLQVMKRALMSLGIDAKLFVFSKNEKFDESEELGDE